ncbi:hypothetical protein L2E82_16161 [Cichorium intybus]|uniref:Uncharacterized protein n=1 Tax=Cichorium intybus TaxID=13427 RepID=A0ACB9F5E8_CICIN|nr:hypothetical protein L2E82_16161 [Cichorium intybus]
MVGRHLHSPILSFLSLTHTDACVCGGFFERFQHAPVFSGLSIPPTLTPFSSVSVLHPSAINKKLHNFDPERLSHSLNRLGQVIG